MRRLWKRFVPWLIIASGSAVAAHAQQVLS